MWAVTKGSAQKSAAPVTTTSAAGERAASVAMTLSELSTGGSFPSTVRPPLTTSVVEEAIKKLLTKLRRQSETGPQVGVPKPNVTSKRRAKRGQPREPIERTAIAASIRTSV